MAFSSQSETAGAFANIALNSSSVSRRRITFTLTLSVTAARLFSFQPNAIPLLQTSLMRQRIACAQRILPSLLIASSRVATSFVVSAEHSMWPIALRIASS
ncbi:hypothetical protein DDK22_37000 [Cupriavidus necator]|uniref:Uncharacterized protein n=1 Tax=Cupriavidus necator TaxID=106590 RepID=A0A367P6Q8_CUPNE|nr:hypothetical protein DDK22_37000 [Cupriavidus necator]